MTAPTIRVLHLIDSLPLGGGAERALLVQLPELRARGVHSEAVVLRGFDGGIQEQVSTSGVTVHVLGSNGFAASITAFRRMVRKIKPDVVHATLFDSCLVSRIALLGTGIPLINSLVNTSYASVRVDSGERSRWKLSLVRAVDRITIRRVDLVHVISEAVRTEATDVLGVPHHRTRLIPRGRETPSDTRIEESRRVIRQRERIADDSLVIASVGRQDHQKDQLTLVRAFARVLEAHPKTRLWLIGREGTQTSAVVAEIDRLGVSDSVRRFGHRDDVVDFLAATDVFAFPSLYEGLGSAAIEAMSIGLPLVVSDTPALVELVGDVARVVRSSDAQNLAAALVETMVPEVRRTMGQMSRQRFNKYFPLEAVGEAHREMYDAVSCRGLRHA